MTGQKLNTASNIKIFKPGSASLGSQGSQRHLEDIAEPSTGFQASSSVFNAMFKSINLIAATLILRVLLRRRTVANPKHLAKNSSIKSNQD